MADRPFTGPHPGEACDDDCHHNWAEIPESKQVTAVALDTISRKRDSGNTGMWRFPVLRSRPGSI